MGMGGQQVAKKYPPSMFSVFFLPQKGTLTDVGDGDGRGGSIFYKQKRQYVLKYILYHIIYFVYLYILYVLYILYFGMLCILMARPSVRRTRHEQQQQQEPFA